MAPRTIVTSKPTTFRPLLAWSMVGFAAALFLQWSQAVAIGGWSGLLAVGEAATVRPLIEAALPGLVTVEGSGHDGQIGYAIALDLAGSEVPNLLVDAGYRYRRIFVPLVASLGGLLRGPALLTGFILLTALGAGMASAAIESIRHRYGWTPWVHLAVLANPGVWMSVRLLTTDVVAFGLAALAVAAYLHDRDRVAIALLIAAALTKDQYLLAAVSVAGHQWFVRRDRLAVITLGAPTVVLASWAGWLDAKMDAGFSPRGNLTWPGMGIVGSLEAWASVPLSDRLLSVMTVVALGVAVAVLLRTRSRLFRWLVAPWVAIALVSSDWVWAVGNNAVRVLAPLLALTEVAVLTRRRAPNLRSVPVRVTGTSDSTG